MFLLKLFMKQHHLFQENNIAEKGKSNINYAFSIKEGFCLFSNE
ncbi:hypothetical protein CP10139811_0048 [Chlamydia ibidis]|uniref:Uncharacterized protein n=2 Tax=Chlamydia ibidis TaxID=1405396 RepID=S7J5W3_9CHLA|nr:hypothetical protein CP10139811_0048 [Chlamydia ibidis]EQM62630.1 hypothetical protein H359_0493 [Chlamydia ibidis 10-1398/6]